MVEVEGLKVRIAYKNLARKPEGNRAHTTVSKCNVKLTEIG